MAPSHWKKGGERHSGLMSNANKYLYLQEGDGLKANSWAKHKSFENATGNINFSSP